MTPTAPIPAEVRAPRPLAVAAVVAALLVQAGLFVQLHVASYRQDQRVLEAVRTENPPGWGFVPLAVLDDLHALEPQIPADARVLLVTAATLPVAYDFPLLPRRLDVLHRLDGLAARAGQLPEAVAAPVREWVARLDAQGRLLDAGHLAARLAEADVLLTVQLAPADLPWPEGAPAPRLVARHGLTTLYELGAP